MPAKPTRKKQKGTATRIEPSMLDQLEAMVRHPEFRRSLALWRSIFSKNYVGLTEKEDKERDAPRTRIRLAAIQEADRQWLSRSIRYIRKHGEAKWTSRAVKLPSGDRTEAVGVYIPADLSKESIQQLIDHLVSEKRARSGLKPIQNLRRPEVDPVKVYDLMQEKGATPAIVRDKLFGPYGHVDRRYKRQPRQLSTQDKKNVKRDLKRVSTAYRYFLKVLDGLNSR